MDEFSEIMGLPEPAGQPGDHIRTSIPDQCQGFGSPRLISSYDRPQDLGPLIQLDGNEYVNLLELYRQYGNLRWSQLVIKDN